ncbi:MAG: alpha-L-rhamnosidase C-terminal domain-containing protein [Bacteroidales bacterium]|nr:alpha-L-rhamnosidase C-terminal domain-containing protein [Bacteroidales bacterium]
MVFDSYFLRRLVVLFFSSSFAWLYTFSEAKKPFVSDPSQLNDNSFAEWIKPSSNANEGVYYFRKDIALSEKPKDFIIYISADNKYKLYVNDSLIGRGPSIGDLHAWNYDTYNLGAFLHKGENIVAVQVVNMGRMKPANQISHTSALIIQGNSSLEQILNTDKSWLTAKDSGYYFMKMKSELVGGGYIAGGTDSLVLSKNYQNWTSCQYNDSTWEHPIELGKGNHFGLNTWVGTPWFLKENKLPILRPEKQRFAQLLSANGAHIEFDNNSGKIQALIPANSHVEFLIDNRVLTIGYPQLLVSGGRNSKIKIQYQEAMFDNSGHKVNRNQWKDMVMKGYYDVIITDGTDFIFEPVSLRTFRFIKVSIDTKNEELRINDFYNNFTAYPFQLTAKFTTDNQLLTDIWNTSWHTSHLCASDTYMDCPYYERLQYIGDTRLQALTSLYVTNDDKLVRNAIEQFYNSMQPMGLTRSSYPCGGVQIIPPFSLIYINMIHDYYTLRDDSAFVKQFILGMKFILEWFINKIDKSGMLGPLPYWNFTDGVAQFRNGSTPGISEGNSALISILLAHTIDNAADIFEHYGLTCDVVRYKALSDSLKASTFRLCYDSQKQLLAETPSKEMFTQHTNSLAILSNMFDQNMTHKVARKIIADTSLVQASLYFDFYVFQALKKANLGAEVIHLMNKWKVFLDNGFTTFPEHGIESRSDCHAWAAHPMYDFLNITCGISSLSAGFKTVEIRPQPGDLDSFDAIFPHPKGEIKVSMKRQIQKIIFEVDFPKEINGYFIHKNEKMTLNYGRNHYEFSTH